MMSPILKGTDGFEKYYALAWGERWEILRANLMAPVSHVARVNQFIAQSDFQKISQKNPSEENGIVFFLSGEESQQLKDANDLSTFYYMDKASLYSALALEVKPGDTVLDMCAAPGGKSLILLEKMQAEGSLVLNEISAQRKMRLGNVIKEYVPEAVRPIIKITGRDACRWGLYEQNKYDKILLDAPCSSERHVMQDPKALAAWTSSRSKNLAKRQYALLVSALTAVKGGGRVVYTTCAISALENDDVIERLLKKKPDLATVVQTSWPIGNATKYGWEILPDATGAGPIYFAVLTKN